MYVLVAGSGKLGMGLAKVLAARGHDVVMIGTDMDSGRAGKEFDGILISGSPVDEAVLESAGAGRAELFVAATADDCLNAMAVQVARELFHIPATLARITDPELEKFYREMGLDTVCPTKSAIETILDRVAGRSV